jgi:hypothetical protein
VPRKLGAPRAAALAAAPNLKVLRKLRLSARDSRKRLGAEVARQLRARWSRGVTL